MENTEKGVWVTDADVNPTNSREQNAHFVKLWARYQLHLNLVDKTPPCDGSCRCVCNTINAVNLFASIKGQISSERLQVYQY